MERRSAARHRDGRGRRLHPRNNCSRPACITRTTTPARTAIASYAQTSYTPPQRVHVFTPGVAVVQVQLGTQYEVRDLTDADAGENLLGGWRSRPGTARSRHRAISRRLRVLAQTEPWRGEAAPDVGLRADRSSNNGDVGSTNSSRSSRVVQHPDLMPGMVDELGRAGVRTTGTHRIWTEFTNLTSGSIGGWEVLLGATRGFADYAPSYTRARGRPSMTRSSGTARSRAHRIQRNISDCSPRVGADDGFSQEVYNGASRGTWLRAR